MESSDVVQTLHELVVVLLHTVAYRCDVYPPSTFSLVRQYGAAARQCNHPGFCRWAESAALAVCDAIGTAERQCSISIVVLENGQATQRVGLTLDPLEPTETLQNANDLEAQYRAVITTLLDSSFDTRTFISSQSTQKIGGPEEPDRSMTIVFDGPAKNEELWLPSQPDTTRKGVIKPVRYVEAGQLGMNVYYQTLHWEPIDADDSFMSV